MHIRSGTADRIRVDAAFAAKQFASPVTGQFGSAVPARSTRHHIGLSDDVIWLFPSAPDTTPSRIHKLAAGFGTIRGFDPKSSEGREELRQRPSGKLAPVKQV